MTVMDLHYLAMQGPPDHIGVAKMPSQGLTIRFTSPCHPRSGLVAIYWNGTMDLKCSKCGTQVAALTIADPLPATTPNWEHAERLGKPRS